MSPISTPQPKKYRAFPPSYFMQAPPGIPQTGVIHPEMRGRNIPHPGYQQLDPSLVGLYRDTISPELSSLPEQSDLRKEELPGSVSGKKNPVYPAMFTIRETLLLWTKISLVLCFLSAIANAVHLWFWVHSDDYYFHHWQIVLVEVVPRTVFISTFCALCMFWFVMCRWYLAQIQQLAVPEKITQPRKQREIIPMFFPIINCWGIPQLLTELLIIIRRYPQPEVRISYQLYLATMRKVRLWSISWIAMWVMTLAEVLASCLAHRADSIALNSEFRIVWLVCIGLHMFYTYKTLKGLTLLAQVVVKSELGAERSAWDAIPERSIDIMAAI